jgi:Zn finger protein HypA/HybF involved in hydrogenase expression
MHHHEDAASTINHDEFEASFDLVDCRNCGRPFNLGAQTYYTNLCPKCYRSEE